MCRVANWYESDQGNLSSIAPMLEDHNAVCYKNSKQIKKGIIHKIQYL